MKHQKGGNTVHFASLMDWCHLPNSELGKNFQEYKEWVVSRGDAAKDDPGSNAVLTEQCSSASHMREAKVFDVTSLPGCAGEASDAVSAYTQIKMIYDPNSLRLLEAEWMPRDLDTPTTLSKPIIMGQHTRSCGTTGNISTENHKQDYCGNEFSQKFG